TVLGPPHIFDLPGQIIDEDTATGQIPFIIGDSESPADDLQVTGTSSNPSLIPDGNIFISGTGSNRTVRLIPLPNQNGTAVISLHVSDPDGGVTVFDFLLTVRPLNDPPVLLPIADQVILEDHPAVISFTADDPETDPGALLVSIISSN